MRWMPLFVVLVACGDPKDKPDAGGVTPDTPVVVDMGIDADPNNPMTLMDTGLCLDAACTQIAPGIRPYSPQFQLWSDGATKKRWIYLPPGTQIDTSNMDFWQFPVGTKLWKEFTRDGVRVETRLVMRIAQGSTNPDSDWFYVAFVWNQTQDATTAEPFGVPDANGTQHDVPNRSQCKICHNNTQPSRVLGFSAIQLDHAASSGEVALQTLIDENLLTNNPTSSSTAGGYFPLPGSSIEKAALGYLHANCGHCHNPSSKVYTDNGVLMQLRETVGTLGTLTSTTVYQTAVNQNGTLPQGNITKLVDPGLPDSSLMILRFESTNPALHMPLLGSEIMDPSGQTILRDWVTSLQ
ncbi:MAG TPA: hypothetical protein VFV99_31210 [Kofleriaceae bacterium]|nr:hypothetical protein [Kofleriaceae bacterium]